MLDPGDRERLDARFVAGDLLRRPRSSCPHPAGAPICGCRPPLPGLAIEAAHAHGLDLGRSVLLGRTAADRVLAQAVGLAFTDAVSLTGPPGK